ncbi:MULTISPECIES: class IV lanthionine synthetase LanL [Streptomyces]|uniref:class IV lanthionine synthetase LanL n=1 Tax=Streptomyces TaxID=1883 RepID=UPI001489C182|nr:MULTISPECIES: class IV lanthionine synthetase LanL [Streptomyces]
MGNREADGGLGGLLEGALRSAGAVSRWQVLRDESWCRVVPCDGAQREQGWKLHVSATQVSAPEVLERALRVLLREDSAFKFASSVARVAALNTRGTPRGSSGKFITVYPRCDAAAVRIADALHRSTAGLAGPRILSDHPYAPDSLVHYRYGSFVGRRQLSAQGLFVDFIYDPEGNPVEDRRTGQYLPPSWAVSPFPVFGAPPGGSTASGSGAPVLGGRFAVREAIRYSNKGGVYRGTDTRTGAAVVIKEARPHVEADASGWDVRDWLRTEAEMLDRLRELNLSPTPLAVFEHGRHVFLAEEEVPGIPLRRWVIDRFLNTGWRQYRSDALDMVARLVDLVATAHEHHCIVRDLTPGNIMVRPDGTLRLIDLELAVVEGMTTRPTSLGTPGFSAPEQLRGAPPAPTADYYSLGATAGYVLTGNVPHLLADEPATRCVDQRRAAWLTACAERLELPASLVTMVLGLTREDPAKRWDLSRARTALSSPTALPGHQGAVPAARAYRQTSADRVGVEQQDQDPVTALVDGLVSSISPDDSRLWPVSTAVGEADPCVVQQGAAGVLAVLTRYFELTGDPRLPEVISAAGRWILSRAGTGPARPGLHFGLPGIAWALCDAGRAIDDQHLMDRGRELGLAPLESCAGHDITHGTAGSGLAALHLWLHTGDERFAHRAIEAADKLAASACRDADGVSWPVPAEAGGWPTGKPYLGFAHGTAGIGYFLLAAALLCERPEHLSLAVEAGDSLLAHAVLTGTSAQWPVQAGKPPTAPYWCHGAAGIGNFLIGLHQVTGESRFADLARRAAQAVAEHATRGPLTQCHGLAGNADFLLDMADATGEDFYRSTARDMAGIILAQRTYRHGRMAFPNEYGETSTSWSDGTSGVLAFLLRLHHGSPRQWTVPLQTRIRRNSTESTTESTRVGTQTRRQTTAVVPQQRQGVTQ